MQIFLKFLQGMLGIIVGGFLGIVAIILILSILYFLALWLIPVVMRILATRRRR